MTREEFIKKWSHEYLGKLMRAVSLHPDSLSARWISVEVAEIDSWLGKLHDALTKEIENAQDQIRPIGKPGTPGGGSAPPASGSPRNAA